jgi:hypothetical protein
MTPFTQVMQPQPLTFQTVETQLLQPSQVQQAMLLTLSGVRRAPASAPATLPQAAPITGTTATGGTVGKVYSVAPSLRSEVVAGSLSATRGAGGPAPSGGAPANGGAPAQPINGGQQAYDQQAEDWWKAQQLQQQQQEQKPAAGGNAAMIAGVGLLALALLRR